MSRERGCISRNGWITWIWHGVEYQARLFTVARETPVCTGSTRGFSLACPSLKLGRATPPRRRRVQPLNELKHLGNWIPGRRGNAGCRFADWLSLLALPIRKLALRDQRGTVSPFPSRDHFRLSSVSRIRRN